MATPTSAVWDFMMGLGKPQRFAKFEIADFIYYSNIKEFVFKNWDKPKWGHPLIFGETDSTVGFADPMFPIRYATVVELRLHQMGNFYEKPHFTMENYKFPEAVKWGFKFFCTKLPKDTLLRQVWWNKSFGGCGSDVVLTLYGGEKKMYVRIAIGNSLSSITLRRYRAVVIENEASVALSLCDS